MRRLSRGCINEAHPLFGTFMKQLSSCIFEWDEADINLLMSAKRGELQMAGIPNPSNATVKEALTSKELARHCRRRTRGPEETAGLIENLLLTLSSSTDTLGIPLFRDEMREIWEEEQRHLPCIHDPTNIPLYTLTGHSNKGGVRLPTLRCARGSTSLESFHLHIARFIPGTSASDLHYQAYLLEGLTRLLTEKHPNPKRQSSPGRRRVYTSRWKLVLSEYNVIRDRLFNSKALLEGTNLALYTLNETTLVRKMKL